MESAQYFILFLHLVSFISSFSIPRQASTVITLNVISLFRRLAWDRDEAHGYGA